MTIHAMIDLETLDTCPSNSNSIGGVKFDHSNKEPTVNFTLDWI